MSDKPIIGILLGDAAGIGPELIAKLLVEKKIQQYCKPIVIGDEEALKVGFDIIGKSTQYYCVTETTEIDWEKGTPLLDKGYTDLSKVTMGEVCVECGKSCIKQIETAVELYKQGRIEGIAYGPLNKGAMKLGGNKEESELKLYEVLFEEKGTTGEINMVDDVWTTRVTSHIPLKNVSNELSVTGIYEAIVLADDTLRKAGKPAPKIGVSAFNPHAGENGLCGKEEVEVIAPAVEKGKSIGIDVEGPFSADILFIKAFNHEYDGIVTMFHDQGQIALKLKGFERGVTIGGGLQSPVVTCAHGTAFDIAGKNIAKTTPMENAIKMASIMAVNNR